MLPYAVSATIIAIVTFILNAYIIPPANETRIDFQNKYIRNKKVDYVKNANWRSSRVLSLISIAMTLARTWDTVSLWSISRIKN